MHTLHDVRGVSVRPARLGPAMTKRSADAAAPSRARKRPVGQPTHVRSWPLRPTSAQHRLIDVRFRAGTRVYNAALNEFLRRSRSVKEDPRWLAATVLPRSDKARRSLFTEAEKEHGWSRSAAMSYGSSLRTSWVREHVAAQEAQSLALRAFEAVAAYHYGQKGKPRFKSAARGVRSMSSKDTLGAIRPATDAAGRLVGMQWGRGVCIPIAPPRTDASRRARAQQAEYEQIGLLLGSAAALSTRIVKTVIRGRATCSAR